MNAKLSKILKSYHEAYEGYSKCWYMYYTTNNDKKKDNFLK